MASRKPATVALTAQAVLDQLRSNGTLGTGKNGAIPVTFNGQSYPSIGAFVSSASLEDLAKVTAEDLENCGNSQATAVFSRALSERVKAEA